MGDNLATDAAEERGSDGRSIEGAPLRDGRKLSTASISYVIPCSSMFRDAVTELATHRGVSAADLARAVFLIVDPPTLQSYADPGEPERTDREIVVVQSGASKDRTLRRKPRLQVRLNAGLPIPMIRRALAMALDMDRGAIALNLESGAVSSGESSGEPFSASGVAPEQQSAMEEMSARLAEAEDEIERLQRLIARLCFQPMDEGVRTRSEALYVLGFPPHSVPEARRIKEKFRLLAKIHHPDSLLGDHQRMAQLNDALKLLQSNGL
ncbi:MAG: J domain-containing protein [Pseudomonadota bacterium]